jgi:hypothetical protein
LTAITKTTAGLNMLRDSMGNLQSDSITYVALGTSNTTPTAADTQLGAEAFRKKVTSATQGANGEILISLYLSPTDAVGIDLEEVGFFGSNASSTINSGVLLAHGLYSHNPKVNTESIQFTLDATIS